VTIIRQGDPRWSDALVGDGQKKFSAVGCLVCCIQQAAMDLVDGATTADPRIANMRGRDAGAFVGSAAIVECLAAANMMRAGPRIEGDVVKLRAVVIAALINGQKVLLHVDHDSTLPKGDPEADHWVLARSYVTPTLADDTGQIICADPATGKETKLLTSTLKGPSGWRDGREYEVKGLRVLSRRAP